MSGYSRLPRSSMSQGVALMFTHQEEYGAHKQETKRGWRVHGATVIALWSIAAFWIALEVAFPPHRTEAILWRASTALALTASASSTMIMWYLARIQVEPANDERRAFRIGYQAGYHDAAEGRKPITAGGTLYLLPNSRTESDTRTGTD